MLSKLCKTMYVVFFLYCNACLATKENFQEHELKLTSSIGPSIIQLKCGGHITLQLD